MLYCTAAFSRATSRTQNLVCVMVLELFYWLFGVFVCFFKGGGLISNSVVRRVFSHFLNIVVCVTELVLSLRIR